MSLSALLLVIFAAFAHATWNLLAKKAAGAGVAFVAAYTGFATLFYAPAAAWALLKFGLPASTAAMGCTVASGVLHLAYSLVLQRGYQVADLSVVYPVARGTGPMLSALGAFIVLGETASLGAIAGLLSIAIGILILATGGRFRLLTRPDARVGVRWGSITGATIAGYTVVDGWGAKVLGINPILLDWCANTLRLVFLLPGIVRDPRAFGSRMEGRWLIAAGVGALAPLGYILVLTALQLGAPLHVIAPARELSMMIGALLAMTFLGEPITRARLGGCTLILFGITLFAY